MADATNDAREYHVQVQNVTKNLGALNAVYEMELQDANTHLKSMNKFYGTLAQAMENLTEAGKETDQFKQEVTSLTTNLSSTSLNTCKFSERAALIARVLCNLSAVRM